MATELPPAANGALRRPVHPVFPQTQTGAVAKATAPETYNICLSDVRELITGDQKMPDESYVPLTGKLLENNS